MSTPSRRRAGEDAEVIVVGAGPAGSTAATYLARAGLDVLLLEKSAFPREKVCGDGLTPRGVKQLIDLGIDTREEAGWLHNRGLRVVGGGVTLELDWPDLASFPPYGVVRTRMDFDELLARTAQQGRLSRVAPGAVGPLEAGAAAAARLWLDLRHGRRHRQRGSGHPVHVDRVR
jgi:2-polyprenyl-6-methoxyphenol hydroxylase-like FAD-dependent oxidoreductase